MARRKIKLDVKELFWLRLVPIVLGITGILYLIGRDFLGGFIFLTFTAWFWFRGLELRDTIGRRLRWDMIVFTIIGSIFLITLLINLIKGL